jgi:hypothetical protein
MRKVMTKSRMRALRFSILLGILMISYQNCSSGVAFEAGESIIASATSPTNVAMGDPEALPPGTDPGLPPISSDPPPDAIPMDPPGVPPMPSMCPADHVQIGMTCVCPAGSNDVGNSCLTCKADEMFNPLTLKCEMRMPVACPAGQTYDGHECVAISAACDSYVEVTSDNFAIPARTQNADGSGKVCYYAKLVSKVAKASSSTFTELRTDIVSRLHGGSGNAPPHVMGSRELKFVLQGDREVVLAGDSHGGDDIYVDNYFLVEVMFPGLSQPNLWASGTADALPHAPGGGTMPIQVNGQSVLDWHAYGSSGTSTFHAINMFSQLTKNKEISFRGSSLDCGSVGESSDVYLLFR